MAETPDRVFSGRLLDADPPTGPGCWMKVVNVAKSSGKNAAGCKKNMKNVWKLDFNSCGNGAACKTFKEPVCLKDKANPNCVSFNEKKCLARGPLTDSVCGIKGTLVKYNSPGGAAKEGAPKKVDAPRKRGDVPGTIAANGTTTSNGETTTGGSTTTGSSTTIGGSTTTEVESTTTGADSSEDQEGDNSVRVEIAMEVDSVNKDYCDNNKEKLDKDVCKRSHDVSLAKSTKCEITCKRRSSQGNEKIAFNVKMRQTITPENGKEKELRDKMAGDEMKSKLKEKVLHKTGGTVSEITVKSFVPTKDSNYFRKTNPILSPEALDILESETSDITFLDAYTFLAAFGMIYMIIK